MPRVVSNEESCFAPSLAGGHGHRHEVDVRDVIGREDHRPGERDVLLTFDPQADPECADGYATGGNC